MKKRAQKIIPIEWEISRGKALIHVLDQTRLPRHEAYIRCVRSEQLCSAIVTLQIRGAPLLGVAAAYGVALEAFNSRNLPLPLFRRRLSSVAEEIVATRPTAFNIRWAVERLMLIFDAPAISTDSLARRIVEEAKAIHREESEMCLRIGANGVKLLPRNPNILTICNSGALATGGIGTAFGVILTAQYEGLRPRVFACETRPLLQGGRLTMWELSKHRIPATLICDGAAAATMKRQRIDCVIAGADRIARNGDTANKIGTYALAIAAKEHRIPFYIAAPTSTFDRRAANGNVIPIEERPGDEIAALSGWRAIKAYNPAFDVTPAKLISAIVTERGVIRPPFSTVISRILKP